MNVKGFLSPVILVFFFNLFTINKSYSGTPQTADAVLPTPNAIFEKHIEAVGGRTVIQSKQSKTLKGTLHIAAMNLTGELNVMAAAPDKIITNVKIPQFNMTSIEGYDGNTGWKMDPTAGNKILTGEELAAIAKKADFYADNLNMGKDSTTTKTLELLDVDGEEQYKVLLVNKQGEEIFLYFSKKTGLLRGKESIESTAYGKLPTKLKINHYTEHEGMKIVTDLSSTQGGVETIIKFNSISFNKIPDSTFATPKEILQLKN
jgi:hypothetical protein